jgi:Xaa-Pro aminopeptidase
MQTPELMADRRRRLLEMLPTGSLAVVPPTSVKHASSDASHRYAPSRNLFYLSGMEQDNSWLLMYRNSSGETGEILFIEPFDPEYEKWFGRRLTKEEASAISGVKDVRTDGGVRGAMERLVARNFLESVYIDYPLAGLEKHPGTRQRFALEIRDAWPHISHGRLSGFVHRMRMVKDDYEISELRRSIDVTGKAFAAALAALRPGAKEYEIGAEMMRAFIFEGACEAFPTILAGGARATCLHYVENRQVLQAGWLLLMDFGAGSGLYSADITRTVPVEGRYSSRQRKLMEIVIEAQAEAIRLLRPGILLTDWNTSWNEFYARRLVEEGVIAEPSALDSVYYHRVGHHLGLDTHDEAVLNTPVQPGMVLTVEPGLYIAAEETGIRIEDDVLVGADVNTVLSSGIPKSPDDIEALMRR